jgi:hypothetical protein
MSFKGELLVQLDTKEGDGFSEGDRNTIEGDGRKEGGGRDVPTSGEDGGQGFGCLKLGLVGLSPGGKASEEGVGLSDC